MHLDRRKQKYCFGYALQRTMLAVVFSIIFVFNGLSPALLCNLGNSQAYAVEADDGSGSGDSGSGDATDPVIPPVPEPEPGPTPEPEPEPSPEPDPDPDPTIIDVGIYYYETNTCLGYASNPDLIEASISTKGGAIQFDSVIFWNDWSENRNSTAHVTWSTSDSSIATISPAGILTAKGDGAVQVRATVNGSHTATGSTMVATAWVTTVGQGDGRYVTAVRILDSNGNELGSDPYVIEADLSTAQDHFYALVDVYDPLAQRTDSYSTRDGLISAQTSDISDVIWYVGDGAMAAVDELSGMYRPSVYGITRLFVKSTAGLGGAVIQNSISINMKDPNGGMVEEGYHPQDSIAIKAYYELYPPANIKDDNDQAYVINKTYSASEVESMGTVTATYTAIGSGSYYTMTGRGVPLSNLLASAGVNINGVSSLAFGTADMIDRPTSYPYIFATNRYYYPNIDIGSYADAVQVYPILALESNEIRNAETAPNYAMSEGTRFRLLFGSTPDGGTSQYQIKWIHTLYVVLAGGPSVEEGDGPGGGGGTPGEGTGTGSTTGDSSGAGDEGIGAGAGLAEGTQGGAESQSLGESDAAEGASGGSGGEGAGSESSSGHTASGAFSVYQVMNKNDSDTETTINPENPFKQLALPLGMSVLVVGGAESLLWYRKQTRKILIA